VMERRHRRNGKGLAGAAAREGAEFQDEKRRLSKAERETNTPPSRSLPIGTWNGSPSEKGRDGSDGKEAKTVRAE